MTVLALLLIQVLTIVAVSRAVTFVATRVGQPVVVGEMVAGVLLGPSFLGWLLPSVARALFPVGTLAGLNILGQLGLVLFMFLVGLRVERGHLRERVRPIAVLAVVTTAVPFICGSVLGWLWLTGTGFETAHRWPSILFVGLAMSVTAFPVLARILESQQLQDSRIGNVAIACAAVSDAAAWMVLAILTAIAGGTDTYVGERLIGLLLFAGVMVFVVRPILRRQLPRMNVDWARLGLLAVAVAAASAATDALGLHAFFGAFFAGVLVAPTVQTALPRLPAAIEPPLTTWLLPVFFAFTGLRTDITVLASSAQLASITALVIAVAILSKFAAPVLMAAALHVSRREGAMLGVLLNTRGMVELVVLNVGLEAGLIPQEAFSALVMMAIVTTTMASPILSRLRRHLPAQASPAAI
jgi:Kef-type K+ transport system membrane component KefB